MRIPGRQGQPASSRVACSGPFLQHSQAFVPCTPALPAPLGSVGLTPHLLHWRLWAWPGGAAHFPRGVPRVATSTSDPTAQPSQLLGSFALGSEEVDSGAQEPGNHLLWRWDHTPGPASPAGSFHGWSPWAIPAGPRVVSFLTTAQSSRRSQEAGEVVAEGHPPPPAP